MPPLVPRWWMCANGCFDPNFAAFRFVSRIAHRPLPMKLGAIGISAVNPRPTQATATVRGPTRTSARRSSDRPTDSQPGLSFRWSLTIFRMRTLMSLAGIRVGGPVAAPVGPVVVQMGQWLP